MKFESVLKEVCEANGWALAGSEATISLPGGRSQKVRWEKFGHEGREMARLYTSIGGGESLTSIRLESALRLNFSLPHGAFALNQGKLVMTETFLVADADASEVESSMRFLAEAGDRYEKLIFGTDRH